MYDGTGKQTVSTLNNFSIKLSLFQQHKPDLYCMKMAKEDMHTLEVCFHRNKIKIKIQTSVNNLMLSKENNIKAETITG